MNIYTKIALLACGVAIASSALTVVAVDAIDANRESLVLTEILPPRNSGGALYTVSNTVTPPTDFTHAAESTINGVVSIKSYATPRGYGRSQSTPFHDPFFDFF